MAFFKLSADGRKIESIAQVNEQGALVNVGYDADESVQKVAMMVWNPNSLAWERSTGVQGGGSGATQSVTTKRIDKPSATVMYVGQATPGTAESSSGWSISKIEFDADGNATAVLYSTGIWAGRYGLSYL